MKAVLVYSGGLDSTTLLYDYKDLIHHLLFFYYGSKHNDREYQCAESHSKLLGKPLTKIDLQFISFYFSSALLKSGPPIPHGHYQDETMRKTVVPFRNGIMLSIAAGYAESIGMDTLLIASHAGDHAIYPDCRPSFVTAMTEAIKCGTYQEIKLMAPYTMLTKRDIALRGKNLGVDYSLTYSCYEGQEVHCGKCGSCTERKEALLGFDTTNYKS